MKKFIFVLAASLLGLSVFAQTYGEIKDAPIHESYIPTFKSDASDKAPLNVILFIGDGMGIGQLSSAMFANDGSLSITNLKQVGWSRTQSYTDFTTDSAASGTAYACGIKTHNGAIGVNHLDDPVPNIPEKIADKGFISGVITTDGITGATPGAFYAHQRSRGMSNEIMADMANSSLTFFAGGCWESFLRFPEPVRDAVSGAYVMVDDLNDPAAASSGKLGYMPSSSVVYDMPEDGNRPFLAETTEYAINYLKERSNKKKGFFLMVEGARVDKYSHGNDFPGMVKEVLDLDKAVAAALKFADEDGHTLVIITADHETGGCIPSWAVPSAGISGGTFSTGGHTPTPVPVFAYGPGSSKFRGVQENSDVSNKIVGLLIRK